VLAGHTVAAAEPAAAAGARLAYTWQCGLPAPPRDPTTIAGRPLSEAVCSAVAEGTPCNPTDHAPAAPLLLSATFKLACNPTDTRPPITTGCTMIMPPSLPPQ
jgi:hypothetical protein